MHSFSYVASVVALVAGVVTAQTPPSYTQAKTNKTLGLKYGSVEVKAGATLPFYVPAAAPILSTTPSLPSNESYIAILVDTSANLSAPIPADLLWFQQDLLSSAATGLLSTSSSAQVPYLAPTSPGHAYVAFLYTQPPGFHIPANFPYRATFRKGFNVSLVAVDFHTPVVAANWFVLGSNCTTEVAPAAAGAKYPRHPAVGRYAAGGPRV